MNFDERAIVVSGGSGGIGFAAATFLLNRGGRIALIDSVAPNAAQKSLLSNYGERAIALVSDVTRREDVETAVETAWDGFGRIDGLVNCAGVDRHHDLIDLLDGEFADILDINVLGSFRLSQAVARRMIDLPTAGRSSCSIVHLSSVNAMVATATHLAYATSKGAIAQMTRCNGGRAGPAQHPGQRCRTWNGP
jgi:NAD(P)-dependent dehydrogenase (short-subunit alcohol dehydrogenase family)